jgi:hypothetical protein
MSLLARRALLRARFPAARPFSDAAADKAVAEAHAKWLANAAAVEHHALGTIPSSPYNLIH